MEPQDIELLYHWENDPETWEFSNTLSPFSRFYLEQYVIGSHNDIYTEKQLRLMISNHQGETLGCIDLFDFDPRHRRAGIGILIAREHRGQGYATEALEIMIRYARETLNLHQIFCHIAADNPASLRIFGRCGFEVNGTKRQWLQKQDLWVDEHFLQLMLQGHTTP